MSASKEKKTRQQLREEGKDKRQIAQEKIERAQKRRHRRQVVVGVIAAVLIVALFIFSSNLPYTTLSALTIGETGYTAAEYSFFYNLTYNNFVNQYGDYLQYTGLDTTKSLSSQQYTEDQTWAQYFQEAAQASMKEMTALYDDAIKNGFELSEEDKTSLDSTITSMQSGYTDAGFTSADAYLAYIYGKGCTVKLVSSLVEKYYIAQSYATEKNDSLTYTGDQLKAYYEENKDNLDQYKYIAYLVDGSVKDDSSADSADVSASPDAAASPSASPDTDAAKAAAMEIAKGIADSIVANATTEEEFKQAVLAQTLAEATESTTQGSSLNDKYADWLKDASRKAGDTTVVETDSGYYAVYFISRERADYKTANVRHILIKTVAGEDGTYTDEAKATAKQKAEDLLTSWKAGDATEDSFAELATASTEDSGSQATGGLYENIAKGQMVAEFNDWCFAEDRKIGDTGIVYGERAASSAESSDGYSGYHIIYYSGTGITNSDTLSEDELRTKDFTAWKDALLANYEIKTGLTAALVK
ncbi:MAG: hypothetical protein CVU91_06700 [Firmicutes bacterium HGW-Firmicutes-16]|nr:MAG: hypothetical protein CVU91_06700 [Firmicutes bacterium HGW-Firmicutes-16]